MSHLELGSPWRKELPLPNLVFDGNAEVAVASESSKSRGAESSNEKDGKDNKKQISRKDVKGQRIGRASTRKAN